MSNEPPAPERSNTLGKASLILSIISLILVFFVGSCVSTVKSQGGNVNNVKPFVMLFGGTFVLIGVIGVGLGIAGLFGKDRPRATAIMGLIFGILTLILAGQIGKILQ